jgi:plasmid segregation protein ParM
VAHRVAHWPLAVRGLCDSGNYAALLAGALRYANATEVERLVLGLPVHNTQKYAAFLKDRLPARTTSAARSTSGASCRCQPLGTLISYIQHSGKKYDPENAYLVIDVGYYNRLGSGARLHR